MPRNHEMQNVDVVVCGAGPVGLLSAYLAVKLGMTCVIVDKSSAPLSVGRADAMNARTLQVLELLALDAPLLKLGLRCDTSAAWKDGQFLEHRSVWWRQLIGAHNKCFLMLGQSHLEKLLDKRLAELGCPVLRNHTVIDVGATEDYVYCTL